MPCFDIFAFAASLAWTGTIVATATRPARAVPSTCATRGPKPPSSIISFVSCRPNGIDLLANLLESGFGKVCALTRRACCVRIVFPVPKDVMHGNCPTCGRICGHVLKIGILCNDTRILLKHVLQSSLLRDHSYLCQVVQEQIECCVVCHVCRICRSKI